MNAYAPPAPAGLTAAAKARSRYAPSSVAAFKGLAELQHGAIARNKALLKKTKPTAAKPQSESPG